MNKIIFLSAGAKRRLRMLGRLSIYFIVFIAGWLCAYIWGDNQMVQPAMIKVDALATDLRSGVNCILVGEQNYIRFTHNRDNVITVIVYRRAK